MQVNVTALCGTRIVYSPFSNRSEFNLAMTWMQGRVSVLCFRGRDTGPIPSPVSATNCRKDLVSELNALGTGQKLHSVNNEDKEETKITGVIIP
jgi:hypothetical protein